MFHSLIKKAFKTLSVFTNPPPAIVWVYTFSSRWLEVVSSECAPANREDVTGIITAVVVKGSSPAIECDQHLDTTQRTHCGRTDKVGIFAVHSLKLHAQLEGVLLWGGRLLLGSMERKVGVMYGFKRVWKSAHSTVAETCSKDNPIAPNVHMGSYVITSDTHLLKYGVKINQH